MSNATRKVVAFVIDTKEMTLYAPDGSKTIIPQGDFRLAPIVQFITPICSMKQVAEVPEKMFNINPSSNDFHNTFSEFEKNSNGFVKFYRIAKSKIKSLFGAKEEEPLPTHLPSGVVGEIPAIPEAVEKAQSAVEEIMAHAVPSTSPDFHREKIKDDETTVVAVVNNEVITDAEMLHGQLRHANQTGKAVGVTRLLERVAAVAGTEGRRHSAEDLLKFLEKGDLPVDDDGNIIIYKVLNYSRGNKDVQYVDCHTGNVHQRIGSLVQMDPKLVDPDRRNDCSNGLHVARRSYVRGFGGNVCVVAKLRPEDVIAVPQYDSNKMRVCAYHIVFELSQKHYQMLKNGRPITDDEEGARLLAQIIAGNHIGITEDVVIGGHRGSNLTVTPRSLHQKAAMPVDGQATVTAIDIDTVNTDDAPPPTAPAMNPKQIAKDSLTTKEATAEPEAPQPPTTPYPEAKDAGPKMASEARQREAKKLFDAWRDATSEKGRKNALQKLKDFKSKARISWESLGIENPATVELPSIAKTAHPGTAAARAVVPPPKPHPPRGVVNVIKVEAKLTLAEQARQFVTNKDGPGLLKFKKERKKSWSALGVSDDELKTLNITK